MRWVGLFPFCCSWGCCCCLPEGWFPDCFTGPFLLPLRMGLGSLPSWACDFEWCLPLDCFTVFGRKSASWNPLLLPLASPRPEAKACTSAFKLVSGFPVSLGGFLPMTEESSQLVVGRKFNATSTAARLGLQGATLRRRRLPFQGFAA